VKLLLPLDRDDWFRVVQGEWPGAGNSFMSQRGDSLRDMLLVLVGLEKGVLDRDVFFKAFDEWDCAGQRSLVEDLLARGILSQEQQTILEKLVAEFRRKCGNGGDDTMPTVGAVALSEVETLGSVSDLTPTLLDAGETLGEDSPGTSTSFLPGWVPRTIDHHSPYGRYHSTRFHAEGGIGTVSLARDGELNRDVALKEIKARYADDPTSQSRFLLEAEVTGGLEHPGIVPVYGLGIDPHGRPFYAMKFIRGESLKDVIARFHADEALKRDPGARGLELRKLLRRFLDVCNTIEYAHTRGVLHRDIKPANIMVGSHGETMVVDWGIAKAKGRPDHPYPAAVVESLIALKSASGATETLPGSTLGTPAYMSSEQAKGDISILGPRSDVYSLGATLYHLLTGKPAFEGEILKVLGQVKHGEFLPPRRVDKTINPALEAICLKAMSLSPADRYSSAKMLADDVERWMADEPVSAHPDHLYEKSRRWMRHHRSAVTAVGAGIVMAIAGLLGVLVVQQNANRNLSLAKDREHEQFQLAMEAIRTFHSGVSEDFLLKQDEFKHLREQLLERAKDFYKKLEEKLKNQSDEQSRQALGLALFELGDLTSRVGSKEEAMEAHQQALAIRRELARSAGASIESRLALAQSLTAIAAMKHLSANLSSAEHDYEEALAILTPLANEFPSDARITAALAKLQRVYANLLVDAKQPDKARRRLDRSKKLWEGLLNNNDYEIEAPSELAKCHHQIGLLEDRANHPKEALTALEEGLKLRRELVDSHPGVLVLRSDLAVSENTLGNVLARNGEPEKALEAYRRGLATRQEIAKANAGVTDFQLNVARSYHSLGLLLAKMGQSEDAISAFRSALQIRREIAEANPTIPQYTLDHTAAIFDMASQVYYSGRIDEAIQLFAEAREIEEKALISKPNSPGLQRNLALNHIALGKILSDTATNEQAIQEYQKSRDIYQILADSDPTDSRSQYELAFAEGGLAENFAAAGKPLEAIAHDAVARAILKKQIAMTPSDTRAKIQLVSLNLEMASLLLREGRNMEADDFLGEFRTELVAMVDKEPEQTKYRRDLATTDDGRSLVKSRTGDQKSAMEMNKDARQRWEKLLSDEPKQYENQQGKSLNLQGLGEILLRSGEVPKACEAFEASRKIAETLEHEHPNNRYFQVALANAEMALGDAYATDNRKDLALTMLKHAIGVLDAIPKIDTRDLLVKAFAQSLRFKVSKEKEHANEAIETLRNVLKAGYRDLDVIRNAPALEPIRSLDGFRTILEEFVPKVKEGEQPPKKPRP